MKRLLLPVAVLLIACCCAGRAMAFVPEPGRYVPPLSATDIVSGKPVALADYKGSWVLLEFWASWCESCQEQMAEVEALASAVPPACRVLSVSIDDADTLPELKALIKSRGIAYPVLHELRDDVANDFGWEVTYLPTSVLIDPEGQIVFVEAGVGELGEIVRFFSGQAAPGGAYQLELDALPQADGSLKIAIAARSPQRLPLLLSFSATREFEEEEEEYPSAPEATVPASSGEASAAAADGASTTAAAAEEQAAGVQENAAQMIPAEPDVLSQSIELKFELTQQDFAEVIIPAEFLRDAWWLTYDVSYVIPGSESFADGEGIQLVQEGEYDPEELVTGQAAEAPVETPQL